MTERQKTLIQIRAPDLGPAHVNESGCQVEIPSFTCVSI